MGLVFTYKLHEFPWFVWSIPKVPSLKSLLVFKLNALHRSGFLCWAIGFLGFTLVLRCCFSGWQFRIYFSFTRKLGKMNPFWLIFFKRDWFNHQLVCYVSCYGFFHSKSPLKTTRSLENFEALRKANPWFGIEASLKMFFSLSCYFWGIYHGIYSLFWNKLPWEFGLVIYILHSGKLA